MDELYADLARDGSQQSWRLRFTRTYPHKIEKVWRAITEPEHLAAWFPCTIEGERRAGAKLKFSFPGEVNVPPITGRMIAFEPPRLMEFDWGGDVIRIELEPDDQDTRFTLYDFIGEYGKAARDAAGWHVCLFLLEAHVAGETKPAPPWKPLFEEYARRFGPGAATIGPPDGHPEAG